MKFKGVMKGCDPWRIGVAIIHSQKGTRHHPFVTPGPLQSSLKSHSSRDERNETGSGPWQDVVAYTRACQSYGKLKRWQMGLALLEDLQKVNAVDAIFCSSGFVGSEQVVIHLYGRS